MRIANSLPQNSAEWLKWRLAGLGASDAPVVMGVSPFTTRFELWLEKTGLGERPEFHPNAVKAMARGTLLEPLAREEYEKSVGGIKFDALNVIHERYDFIRASLDGYNASVNRIVEIKCPGKADLAEAAKGRVPKKYLPQVQLQLLVTGAVACDYFTFDGVRGSSIEVLPDPAYQAKLEAELVQFWHLVKTGTPPELSLKDVSKAVKAMSSIVEKLKNAYGSVELALETYIKQTKDS
jgi:putative phage-type endonuclease